MTVVAELLWKSTVAATPVRRPKKGRRTAYLM